MAAETPTRDQLAGDYIDQLPYEPYPVQEEALLAWFTSDQGVLMCAPTGMGKTLVAHGALFEALHRGEVAYYTTPLIALTEQKFHELQTCAENWGFSADDVGLVTGNRRVNPNARVLVVVAEILVNRLLNPATFDLHNVSAVVMDEFHSFNDPERGIVWELSLSLLPEHVRLMLLSATVGNAPEFMRWLERCHGRKVELVRSNERKVPLSYHWVADQFLTELLPDMVLGDETQRKTPALVFCFNREECWSVAEQLKGLDLLTAAQRERLRARLDGMDWSQGVGPKIRQILWRGVGVHHAGMLPRYRRLVEDLYGEKLLSVCVCTETLAAGINLPARSVVLSALMKGPTGKKRLIPASSAHQIFGRAGRPQFDTEGHVFALAHEDDVRILRWQEKFDSIPENTKDPGLLKARKALKKKKPTRRDNQQYWTEAQFQKLTAAPPGNLSSRGPLPWRLLAYMLRQSPEIEKIRTFVGKRLMDSKTLERSQNDLDRMLCILDSGGFIRLEPPPPQPKEPADDAAAPPPSAGLLAELVSHESPTASGEQSQEEVEPAYVPVLAHPTERLSRLLVFRGVHPVYGAYLLDHLAIADRDEKIQALESVMELPGPLLHAARVPPPEQLPPGPLATTRIDPELASRGYHLDVGSEDDGEGDGFGFGAELRYPPTLAEKLRALFDELYPGAGEFRTQSVWMAGEVLRMKGDFNEYVKTYKLVKQEGIVFRHLLRLILLCSEFAAVCPDGADETEWKTEFRDLAEEWTACCRAVDRTSTDRMIEDALAADVIGGEGHERVTAAHPKSADPAAGDDWKSQWEKQWEALADELTPDEPTT